MEISIAMGLKIDDKNAYNLKLNIPVGSMNASNPLQFLVTDASQVALVDLAYGDADHIFVSVAPPQALLQETGVVDDLSVAVNTGAYDKKEHRFLPEH